MWHKIDVFSYFILLMVIFSVALFVITCKKKETNNTLVTGVSSEGQIIYFALNDQSIPINQTTKTIETEMTLEEFDAGIFTVTMKLSMNATVTPENDQEILLFIENGKAQQKFRVMGPNKQLVIYELIIHITNLEPLITKFSINNKHSIINQNQKTIELYLLPTEFNDGQFTPKIEVSRGAEISESDLNTAFLVNNNNNATKSYTVFLSQKPEIISKYEVNIYQSDCEIFTEKELHDQLTAFADDKNAYCVLKNDIYLTSNWEPISNFYGIFNGQNFTIYNLKINKPNEDKIGFFKELHAKEIKNIKFKNVDIKGRNYVGTLSGQVREGIILTQVRMEGSVEANDYVGGFYTFFPEKSQVSYPNFKIHNSSFSGKVYRKSSSILDISSGFLGFHAVTIAGGFINANFSFSVKESYFDGILNGVQINGIFPGTINSKNSLVENVYVQGTASHPSTNSLVFSANQVDFSYSTMTFPDGNYYLGDNIANSLNNSLFVPMPQAGVTLHTPDPPYKKPIPLTPDQVRDRTTFINKGFDPAIWRFYTDGRWPTLINTPENW